MVPLVSIIIPTYNREHLIEETLDSVLKQSHTNWECIVVDDGSNDNTKDLLKSYVKMDDRIKFYHRPKEKPKGASSCRNYGIERSKGEFIQFLDSDDTISSEKLSSQLNLLQKNTLNSLATCKWGTFICDPGTSGIHQNLKAYGYFEEPLQFIEAMGVSICYFPIHAYLIRKSVITNAGHWNEYLSLNDDSEFMMRVITNSHRICFSEECFAYYRLPLENNLSLFNNQRKILDAIYSWNLIENHLKIRFKKEQFLFIERAKNDFYQHVKVFPELIKKNKEFFRVQLRKESSWRRHVFSENK